MYLYKIMAELITKFVLHFISLKDMSFTNWKRGDNKISGFYIMDQ